MPLSRRLVMAQGVVVAAMALSVVVVAALVAPPLFDLHMREAGHDKQPGVLDHAETAFRDAGVVGLGAGVIIAALGAVVVSGLLTRGLGRHLDALVDGAERVGHGVYNQPVPAVGGSRELDAVTEAFNDMAERIAASEQARRRMLTDLAHEMRTPIASLRVTVEALEDGFVDLDEHTVSVFHDQLSRLTRLASDIKDVSAAEEGRLDLHRELVDLSEVLAASGRAFGPQYTDAGVVLDIDSGTASGRRALVRADRARVGQVVDNLLRNALQHTPSGGQVNASADIPADAGEWVRIVVKDTGIGIDAHDLAHLFERFYRADTSRPHDSQTGTGVGLSISRAIAVAHGGTLTAHSRGPGHGATFVLTLPAAAVGS